jgi:hypothetical protein
MESIFYKSTEQLWEQRWHLHTPTSSWGFSTNVGNWTRHSVGGSFTALWSQASRHTSIPSLCGILVYNDVTSIETRMVPEGRGFMDSIFCSPHKPLSWFRFIDDVDMKWTESEENHNRFFDHANNVHPTIKCTHETSRNNISFLDTYTTCENGIMSTDIYSKPTDKHQYLSPQSCHPKHCTKSIPYSQALRIKRICSNEQTTKKRLGELKCHLKKRGYNNASINHCFNKASGIYRKDLIQKRTRTTECHLSLHTILRSVIYPAMNFSPVCVLLNFCVHWMFLHVIHRLESHF